MARRTLYILIGSVVLLLLLIGVGIFAFLPMLTSAHTSQTTATPTVAPTTTPTKQSGNGIGKLLKQYAPDIKNQIAQGLKLSPDQLTTQLLAGKTLSDIATAQGLSLVQLQTLISNTMQTSLKPAIDNGDLTQKQLNKLSKRYENNPSLLDKLLGGKGVKQALTPTPAT
ncbi:MAG: hypothetical protein NVS4B11_40110 [Ktedonobacteraceae bacterium]